MTAEATSRMVIQFSLKASLAASPREEIPFFRRCR